MELEVHIWFRHHRDKTLRAEVQFWNLPRHAWTSSAVDVGSDPFKRVATADREHASLEAAQAFADSAVDELHICDDRCGEWYRLI